MRNLPKIFKNKNNVFSSNNKNVCYLKKEQEKTIEEDLKTIFNDIKDPSNINNNYRVFIKTKTKSFETTIIIKTKKSIITIDDETIPIEDILYIKKV